MLLPVDHFAELGGKWVKPTQRKRWHSFDLAGRKFICDKYSSRPRALSSKSKQTGDHERIGRLKELLRAESGRRSARSRREVVHEGGPSV